MLYTYQEFNSTGWEVVDSYLVSTVTCAYLRLFLYSDNILIKLMRQYGNKWCESEWCRRINKDISCVTDIIYGGS